MSKNDRPLRPTLAAALFLGAVALFLLPACGEVSGSPDATAGRIDASTSADGGTAVDAEQAADATQPDARTTGMVTVRTLVGTGPLVNVPVFYHYPDGSFAGFTNTDDNGQIVIDDVPIGGMVTVAMNIGVNRGGLVGFRGQSTSANAAAEQLRRYSGNRGPDIQRGVIGTHQGLATHTDVQPGDVLTFTQPDGTAPPRLQVAVTLPTATVANATRYYAWIGCNSRSTTTAGSTLTLTLWNPACATNSSGGVDVMVVANDASRDRLAYAIAQDVQLNTSATPAATVTMGPWKSTIGAVEITASNVPANGDVNARVHARRDGVFLDRFSPSLQLVNGSPAAFTTPTGLDGTGLSVDAYDYSGTSSANAMLIVPDIGAIPATTPLALNVDISQELLPFITDVIVRPNATDSSRFEAAYTLGGANGCRDNPGDPDVVFASFFGSAPGPQGNTLFYSWTIATAKTDGSAVVLPELPPAFAVSFWPTATFNGTPTTTMFAVAESTTDYSDLRTSINGFSAVVGNTNRVPAGTLCTSSWGELLK